MTTETAIDIGSVLEAAKLVVSRKLTQLGTTGEIRCADCQASQGQLFGHFEGATRYGDHYSCPIERLAEAIKAYDLQASEAIDITLQTFTTDCGWCGSKGITVSGVRNDEGQITSLCSTEGCEAKLVMPEPILTT